MYKNRAIVFLITGSAGSPEIFTTQAEAEVRFAKLKDAGFRVALSEANVTLLKEHRSNFFL